jgi:hypothetical protein
MQAVEYVMIYGGLQKQQAAQLGKGAGGKWIN